jgi:hypothetical protein
MTHKRRDLLSYNHKHLAQFISINEVEQWEWPQKGFMLPAIVLLHRRPLAEIVAHSTHSKGTSRTTQ